MIHSAKELTPEQRRSVESLLGRSLRGDEELSIRVLPPSPEMTAEWRRELLTRLDAYFAEVDKQRSAARDEIAEDAINEALRSPRPNYRPMH